MIDGLKPYPEYKVSALGWLGRIPSHWDEQPGFAVFREKQEKNYRLRERRVLSLSYGHIVIKPPEKLHGLVPESFETYQIVNPGDIIIRSTDLQNDWNSLRVGLVRDRGIITSAYLCFQNLGSFSPEFAFLLLHSYDLQKFFYGLGSGLRQNLDFSDFKRLPFPIPPSQEQAAIVRFLDHANRRIERAIRAKKKLIALLNEQKQAIIHRALTRGLDPNIPFKPSGIPCLGDIPRHWQLCRLKLLVQVKDGTHDTPTYRSPGTNTYPLVTSRHIIGGVIEVDRANHISAEDYEAIRQRSNVVYGDIIMPMIGTIGNPVVVRTRTLFAIKNVALFKTSTSRELLADFLNYLLESPFIQRQFDNMSRGGVQGFVSLGVLRNLFVPKLDTEEQAAIVKSIDRQLVTTKEAFARAEREIELLREYRIRLVADVVTGKLDVRAVASLLPTDPEQIEVATDEMELGEQADAELTASEELG